MLYLDCSRGIAGDMFVGALIDLGADPSKLVSSLSHLADISVIKVVKSGIPATRFIVDYPHEKEEYGSLIGKIRALNLDSSVEELALSILGKLAEAESQAHSVPVSQVHLHEAADSVVDAAASALCLHELGLIDSKIFSSKVGVGDPAPATLNIIGKYDIPFEKRGCEEITTPTGAAILAALADEYGSKPPKSGQEGFGAGAKDFDYPNVLKVFVASGG